MKHKVKIALTVIVLMAVSVLCAILMPQNSLAVSKESTLSKVYSGVLYRCYKDGYIKPTVKYNSGDLSTPAILWEMNSETKLFTSGGVSTPSVLFPNGWVSFRATGGSESNVVMNDSTTCRSLIEGISTGALTGISGKYTLPTDAVSELEALGYSRDESLGQSISCIDFGYDNVLRRTSDGATLGSNGSFQVGKICYSVKNNKSIMGNQPISIELTEEAKSNGFNVYYRQDGRIIISFTSRTSADQRGMGRMHNWELEIPNSNDPNASIWSFGTTDKLAAAINEALSDSSVNPAIFDIGVCSTGEECQYTMAYKNATVSSVEGDSPAGIYSWLGSSYDRASMQASINILKESNRVLSNSEVASIYMDYVGRYMGYVCDPNESAMNGVNANWKLRLKEDGVWKDNCYITLSNLDSYNGVDSNNIFGVKVGVDEIVAFLRDNTSEDSEDAEGLSSNPEDNGKPFITVDDEFNEDNNNEEAVNDVCYGAEGTLGLSWILCPITQMLYNALDGIYETAEKNFLQLQPELLGDKTRGAWDTFQNIANIVFVILLLVVIFSQLTGVGIDNYGIKKILPRLIICAILVNLSFFIVQLLFDGSNIIGVSIRSLFERLSTNGDQATGGAVAGEFIGGGLITGAAGIAIAAFAADPALLLSLLLALITGVFSVLTLLAILIAREVGVVIAVIVAPLAFASYMLPNTSKWLKSWGNLVKGLLLLYPLTAGVVGASAFVGGIIGNIDKSSQWLALAAMLVRVIPFFFLPTLFRRSISAMGNLGATIQGFGRGLSRGATGAMRGAGWYKNAQERGMERRTRIGAGINRDGTEATGWRGLLRSRNNRNRARYRQQYLKNQSEQEKANLLNSPKYLEAMRQKQALDLRAEQNEIDLMNTEDYRSAARAKQDTDLEKKQTEAQASAITTGAFKRSDGTNVNTSSLSALAKALQYEASRKDADQNISKIRALYDAILAKGDDGIDALANVWDSGSLKGRGLQRIIESIASDGNIKAKARSLHAVANDVMNPRSGVTYTAGQVEDARTAGTYASKIKPEMISNMTDNERDSYIQYANTALTSASTPAERESVTNAMRNVYLASQNINSFKPGEQRAVYDVADRYVQDHVELAKAGTYTNDYGAPEELRRDSNGRLVRASDGSEITSDWFKSGNYRLKRN